MTIDNSIKTFDREKFLFFIIISVGIFIRIFMAYWHFTHFDDIGVLVQYLSSNSGTNEVEQGVKMSSFWTYAPLQGIFISLFVNKSFPYQLNIFLSRLPSCLFGIFSIAVAVKFSRFFDNEKKKHKYIPLLVCVLLSFSWENIIYSAQAEPYSIVVFFGLLLLLSSFQKFYESLKMTFLYLLIFTVGCYGHYQFFILVFCYYVALFFCNFGKKKNLIHICIVSFGNLFLTLPLLCFFISHGRIMNGISWNRGIDGSFFLTLSNAHIANNICHFLKFFASNTFYIFKYFFTSDSFDIISNILAFFLLMVATIGFFFIHKRNQLLAIFSDMLIALFVILVTIQKLTFGPSRHALFIFPMLLLFISYGLEGLSEFCMHNANYKKLIDYIFKNVFVFLCISFIFSLPREIGNRKNFISEQYLVSLIEKYSPTYVYCGYWTPDLGAMSIPGAYNCRATSLTSIILAQNSKVNSTIHRYLLLSRTSSLENFFENKELKNAFERYNSDFENTKITDFRIVYKKEILSQTEIEYASKLYSNYGNGLHVYIIETDFPTSFPEEGKNFSFFDNRYLSAGKDINGIRYIAPQGFSCGPYWNLQKGNYTVIIRGNNLAQTYIDVYSSGFYRPAFFSNISEKEIRLEFSFDKDVEDFEVYMRNDSEKELNIESFVLFATDDIDSVFEGAVDIN